MGSGERGVVAAGHPLTAQAGARVLREGGNAVDAAVGAMLVSFVAEPLLTGLGAGGYLMVAGGGWEPALLDFFVEAPARATDGSAAELRAIDVSFGDAAQVFHIGPASCGVYGTPAGVCEAIARWGTVALAELAAPAAAPRARRRGAERGAGLRGGDSRRAAALHAGVRRAVGSRRARAARGGGAAQPRARGCAGASGREGAGPFYAGDIAAAVSGWLGERGGSLTAEALAAYRAQLRAPVRVGYRDREVLTNPPPSAGGTLLAYALGLLDRRPGPPALGEIVAAMAAAQGERTPEFVEGLGEEGFLERFLASRLGATTHISVLDGEGRACSVTCTNGEGSGVVVPGTGIHVNNIMGEQDLNPLGFHRHPAGRRMPSMMAPSVVIARGRGRAGAGQRRLQPHPLGAAADDRRGR